MRALFLLLLLANLLFLAWSQWIAPAPPPPGHATPVADGAAEIRLLREAPLGKELASDEVPVENAGQSEVPLACVSAGPFLDRAAAEQGAARLEGRGFTSRLRESLEEVRVGLWVRVEGFATPADAANALAALRWAGIEDAYVINEDTGGTTISLGIFGGQAGAAEATKIAKDAGFEAVTTDRMRESDVYWLDVDPRSNGGLPALEDVADGVPGGSPPLELRSCPQSGPDVATSAREP